MRPNDIWKTHRISLWNLAKLRILWYKTSKIFIEILRISRMHMATYSYCSHSIGYLVICSVRFVQWITKSQIFNRKSTVIFKSREIVRRNQTTGADLELELIISLSFQLFRTHIYSVRLRCIELISLLIYYSSKSAEISISEISKYSSIARLVSTIWWLKIQLIRWNLNSITHCLSYTTRMYAILSNLVVFVISSNFSEEISHQRNQQMYLMILVI